MADLEWRVAELERRLANMVRLGVIAEADYQAARVRVRSGDFLSGWLPWLTTRAGNDRTWWAPEIGEQVVIFSPNGEPALGVVLPAIYRTASPAPENDPDVCRVVMGNGMEIEHNRSTGKLTLSIRGDLEIQADGNIAISGTRIDLNQ